MGLRAKTKVVVLVVVLHTRPSASRRVSDLVQARTAARPAMGKRESRLATGTDEGVLDRWLMLCVLLRWRQLPLKERNSRARRLS